MPARVALRPPLPRSPQGVYVLHPGDVWCADQGDRLQTLLGSCVSICLSNPQRTVGGMCHYMYSGEVPFAHRHNTAYAEPALKRLFANLRSKGVKPENCEAFVYGGGCLFQHDAGHGRSVGARNAQWALDFLADAQVHVIAQSLGGAQYRKVDWRIGAEAPEVHTVPMQHDE